MTIFIVILGLLLIVGPISWYYFFGPCGTLQVKKVFDNYDFLSVKFLDSVEVASQTSRIALSSPISNLQSIRQETSELEVPVCMVDARGNLLNSMQHYIDVCSEKTAL